MLEKKNLESVAHLCVRNGKFEKMNDEGAQLNNFVEGCIEDICTITGEYDGDRIVTWCMKIRDGEELLILYFFYSSFLFHEIMSKLAAHEELTATTSVRIKPTGAGAVIYADGFELDKPHERPEPHTKRVGRTARMVETILQKIKNNA